MADHVNTVTQVAQTAVAVKSATSFWTAVGIWVFGSSGLIGAYMRWGPEWLKSKTARKQLEIAESERLRLDRREDYKELRKEFDQLKRTNVLVVTHCTAVDVRMAQLEWVIGLTLDEIDRLDSSNPVAKQAREMFGRMFPVVPLSVELEKLRRELDEHEEPKAEPAKG
jgi:hypothetical protein